MACRFLVPKLDALIPQHDTDIPFTFVSSKVVSSKDDHVVFISWHDQGPALNFHE
jgi:hypothetical protein